MYGPPNSMQGSMGLSPDGSGFAGAPTPSIAFPPTRHPGDVSAYLSQQGFAQSFTAADITSRVNFQTGGIFNPQLGGGFVGAGGNALSTFGNHYSTLHDAILAGRVGPYGGAMGGLAPVPGMSTGMLPPAAMLTDPQYGIYRQGLGYGGGAPVYPGFARQPLFQGPTYQGIAPSRFGTPMDQALSLAMERDAQYHGAATAALSVGTRGAVDYVGSRLGSGLGAAIGARFGGATGARIGSMLGGAAGFFGTDRLVGESAGEVVTRNPLTNLAQRTAQVQTATSSFILNSAVSGIGGKGLDTESAMSVARFIQREGYQAKTGFNAADMMKILSEGGRAGLFDGALQGTAASGMTGQLTDVKSKVVAVASTLKQFMQVANEPDVVAAIKQLGQMKNMGLSLAESMNAAQNAKMYARMAGASMEAMGAAGQAGAMLFQGMGMTAGLGMQMGMGATGMARQAVLNNTYTPQQLALMGGVQGVAQRQMETSAAFLRVPMVTAGVMQQLSNGSFGLDASKVRGLAAGRYNIQDLAANGVNTLSAAIAKDGIGAYGMYMMQQGEMQDQLGKTLGPEGTQMAMLMQVKRMQEFLGLQGPGGYALAASKMFKNDPEAARAITLYASNPENFRGLQRSLAQKEADAGSMRYMESLETLKAARSDDSEMYKKTIRPVAEYFGDALENAGSGIGNISLAFSNRAKDVEAREKGLYNIRYSSQLVPESEEARRTASNMTQADIFNHLDPRMKKAALTPTDTQQLGDQSNLMTYYRSKMGQSTGALQTGRKLVNTLTGGATSVANLEDEVRDFDEGSAASRRMLESSQEEISAAKEALVKKFGSLEAAQKASYDLAAQYQQIGQATRGETTAGGYIAYGILGTAGGILGAGGGAPGIVAGASGGLWAADALVDADDAAGTGFLKSQSRAMKGAERTAAVGRTGHDDETARLLETAFGKNMAITSNKRQFDTQSAAAAYTAQRAQAASKEGDKKFSEIGGKLMNGKGWAWYGKDTDRIDVMSKMFLENEKNDKASILAALQEVRESGTEDEQQKALALEKELGVDTSSDSADMRIAANMRARLAQSGQSKNLRAVGARWLTMGKDAVIKEATEAGEELRSYTGYVGLMNAAPKIGIDAAEKQAAGLQEAWLDKGAEGLIARVDSLGGVDKAFRKDTYAYGAVSKYYEAVASDPSKMLGAREELAKALIERSPLQRESQASGYVDKNTQGQADLVAMVGREMAQNFPQAVNTFRASAKEMYDAAQALHKVAAEWAKHPTLAHPSH